MTWDNILGGIICAGISITMAGLTVSLVLMIWEDIRDSKKKRKRKR
jgi:hypothetical protein